MTRVLSDAMRCNGALKYRASSPLPLITPAVLSYDPSDLPALKSFEPTVSAWRFDHLLIAFLADEVIPNS